MWLNNITVSTKVWYESLMILKSLNKRNPASTTLLILTAFYTAQKVIPGEESFTRFLLDLIPRIGHMFNKIYFSAYASPSYYGWDYKLRGWDVNVRRESRDIRRYRELINTYSPSAYFKWIKLENVNVTANGDYVITLKNIKGVNAVNVVLMVPESRLEALRDCLQVLLKDKLIVYIDKKFYEIPVLVDQENVPEEWVSQNYNISYLYAVNVYGNLSVAQTFIPTKPRLAGVEIWIGKWSQYIQPDLLVKLVSMGDEGPVLSDVLCEAKVSHEEVGYGFTFIKLNCTLTVGKSYAIVFSSPGNFSQSYLLYYPRTPFTYSGGYMLTSENGKTWHKSNYSLIFRTYYYSEPKQTFNLDKAEKSEVFLYRYNLDNNSYIPIESLPKPSESAEILSFSMPAPSKYVITLNTSRMFVLIVGEHDPLWTTNIKGAFIVPVLSTMNGYLINQTGVIKIIVEYSLNYLYNVGILISIVSLSVLFLLAIMLRYTYNKFAELRIQIKKLRRH